MASIRAWLSSHQLPIIFTSISSTYSFIVLFTKDSKDWTELPSLQVTRLGLVYFGKAM